MKDETNILDSEYVYIGEDEKYHIKDDAPEELKKQFIGLFASLKTENDGVITLF